MPPCVACTVVHAVDEMWWFTCYSWHTCFHGTRGNHRRAFGTAPGSLPRKRKRPKFFLIHCAFTEELGTLQSHFRLALKQRRVFAIPWLFKCKAPLNPRASSSVNRVCRDVRTFALASRPASRVSNFLAPVRGSPTLNPAKDRFRFGWRHVLLFLPRVWRCFLADGSERRGAHDNFSPGGFSTILSPSDVALTYLLLSFSPQFLSPLRHLFAPRLLIWSASCAAPSAFDIHPLQPSVWASRRNNVRNEMRTRLSQRRPRLCGGNGERRQNCAAILSACKSRPSLCPIGIVKGRRRQTWRKYPINLQDISREAPFRTGADVTLGASMSKHHDKLLHIISCFYLMIALCVWVVPFFQTVINNALRGGQETHWNTHNFFSPRLADVSEWKWRSKSRTT